MKVKTSMHKELSKECKDYIITKKKMRMIISKELTKIMQKRKNSKRKNFWTKNLLRENYMNGFKNKELLDL